MRRHTLREHCFRILFGLSFYDKIEYKDQLSQYLDDICEIAWNDETEDDIKLAKHLSSGDKNKIIDRISDISSHLSDIDDKIESVSSGWKVTRIGKTELSIIRIAVYEIFYDELVPDKVAINEAIELAKIYCADEASSFINGILAKLV